MALSQKAFFKWYDAAPQEFKEGDNTCDRCGKVASHHEVQLQHPMYAGGRVGVCVCVACIGVHNLKAKADYKAVLAAMPKCEVCEKHRGNFNVKVKGGEMLICGRCLKKARNKQFKNIAGTGFEYLAMFSTGPAYTKEGMKNLASG